MASACAPSSSSGFVVAIHGGAGVISTSLDGTPYFTALRLILQDIYSHFNSLEKQMISFTAVDIVEYATVRLEEEPLFNAGKGAVYSSDGSHELEASLMDGSTLQCGAVSMLKRIRNPIKAARLIMEKTPHIYMVGVAAESLAIEANLESVDNTFFDTDRRLEQLHQAKKKSETDASFLVFRDHDLSIEEEGKGTVGCVAMYQGSVAAATSTGGMTNKYPGRIGDSPIIGSGTYANNRTCAVSATGTGEEFMRHLVAHDISARIEHGGMSLQQACKDTVFKKLPELSGGIIAIDCEGNVVFEFNCGGMFRGCFNSLDPHGYSGSIGIWDNMESFHLRHSTDHDNDNSKL